MHYITFKIFNIFFSDVQVHKLKWHTDSMFSYINYGYKVKV